MWAFRRYQSQAQAMFLRLSRLLSSVQHIIPKNLRAFSPSKSGIYAPSLSPSLLPFKWLRLTSDKQVCKGSARAHFACTPCPLFCYALHLCVIIVVVSVRTSFSIRASPLSKDQSVLLWLHLHSEIFRQIKVGTNLVFFGQNIQAGLIIV